MAIELYGIIVTKDGDDMKRTKFDKVIMFKDDEYLPDCCDMEDGVIYVSEAYKCAKHKCPCGCGEIVVMTLDRQHGWRHNYHPEDGTIHFYPSIGNYNFPCKSHYFIHDNIVRWCL